jgi:hypothetical protein
MSNCQGFNRRAFFGSVVAAGLSGSAILGADSSARADESPEQAQPEKFMASYPLLQNVTETSASISWALNVPSTGWV